MFEKNSTYKLTNIHGVETIIKTNNKTVVIVNGFVNGYAGTIKEFSEFVMNMAKSGLYGKAQPIKIEKIL